MLKKFEHTIVFLIASTSFARYLVTCFVVSVSIVLADETEETKAHSKDPLFLSFADKLQESLSEQLISISDSIDNFFVNERMDYEGSRSRVVLSYFLRFNEFQAPRSEYLIRARLNFPKTQHKLKLVVESSVGLDNVAEDGEVSRDLINAQDDAQYSTALQFVFSETKNWQVTSSAGMRFATPLDPFLRLRFRRHFFNHDWIFRLVETFFWYEQEGFGEYTEFNAERKLSDIYYFRSSSKLSISEDAPDLNFTHRFTIIERITDRKAMAYSVGMESQLNQPAAISRYYTNIAFRHNFYKKWAFYEIIPELSFPRKSDYKLSPSILFVLDVVIGKI